MVVNNFSVIDLNWFEFAGVSNDQGFEKLEQKIAVFKRSRPKGLINVYEEVGKKRVKKSEFHFYINTLTITADEHIPNANTLVKLNLFNTIDRDYTYQYSKIKTALSILNYISMYNYVL